MQRRFLITSFFLVMFACLCLVSCTCDSSADLTVPTASCNGFFCYSEGESTTLEGCHVENSCIDCYWFPTAIGCYGNEFTSSNYFEGCLPPSCVICGFDCTLLECYGHVESTGTNHEERPVKAAVEGVDYRIDSFVVKVDDHVQEFANGKITWDDVRLFVELLNLKDAATLRFYVEYTAFSELHSTEFTCDFEYGFLGEMSGNAVSGVHVKAGNVPEFAGEPNWKSDNIQPGKHLLTATVSMNSYELIALENIPSWNFSAYTYGGEQ